MEYTQANRKLGIFFILLVAIILCPQARGMETYTASADGILVRFGSIMITPTLTFTPTSSSFSSSLRFATYQPPQPRLRSSGYIPTYIPLPHFTPSSSSFNSSAQFATCQSPQPMVFHASSAPMAVRRFPVPHVQASAVHRPLPVLPVSSPPAASLSLAPKRTIPKPVLVSEPHISSAAPTARISAPLQSVSFVPLPPLPVAPKKREPASISSSATSSASVHIPMPSLVAPPVSLSSQSQPTQPSQSSVMKEEKALVYLPGSSPLPPALLVSAPPMGNPLVDPWLPVVSSFYTKVEGKEKPQLIERVHFKFVPSVAIHARLYEKENPLAKGQWRVYTADEQSYDLILFHSVALVRLGFLHQVSIYIQHSTSIGPMKMIKALCAT